MLKSTYILKSSKTQYVDRNGNMNHSNPDDRCVNEKDKLYDVVVNVYDKLIQSDFSVFSSKNTIFDLIVKDEGEMALLQNYRISEYNRKLNVAQKLYRKIVKD
jgi:hypothetical protein